MTNHITPLALTLTTLTTLCAPAFSAVEWQSSVPAALEQAAAENKKVLVVFTGSDWCGPCIALKNNVLSTQAFADYAKDKYVLVELDFPRKKQQEAALKAANEQTAQKYDVGAFPTLLVLNPQGVAVAGMIGGKPDVEQLAAALKEELSPAFVDALQLSQSATGVEKAKALKALYDASPEKMKKHNAFLLKEVMALDTEDSLGLKESTSSAQTEEAYLQAEQERLRQLFGATGKDFKAGLAILNKELEKEDIHPQMELSLLILKRELLFLTAETPEDVLAIQSYMKDTLAKKIPAQATQIIEFADTLPAQTETILQRSKEQREEAMKAN